MLEAFDITIDYNTHLKSMYELIIEQNVDNVNSFRIKYTQIFGYRLIIYFYIHKAGRVIYRSFLYLQINKRIVKPL